MANGDKDGNCVNGAPVKDNLKNGYRSENATLKSKSVYLHIQLEDGKTGSF